MSIQELSDRWFLSEPLLFVALCSHKLVENRDMRCAIRSGKLRIEYNPDIIKGMDDIMLELMLRREVLRILLKHPYQRQPLNAYPAILTLASNVTIDQHDHSGLPVPLLCSDINLPEKLSFEEYYNLLSHAVVAESKNSNRVEQSEQLITSLYLDSHNQKKEKGDDRKDESNVQHNGDGKDKSTSLSDILNDNSNIDASALWGEDKMIEEKMNRMIENAMVTNQWGSIGGNIKELIKASTIRADNIRRKMDMFRTSIISTNRRLTRMRPSRRYGWTQMGVIHPYTSRLLVAVDTSASVKQKDLIRFFGVINSFFTYGIPFIDVLQFDAKVNLPLLTLHNVTDKIELRGRGGTNFQAPVDFFIQHKEYDGMIVFTDGDAPFPDVPPHKKVLWVLKDITCYNNSKLSPKVYI